MLTITFSFVAGVAESRINTDDLHWGLIYSSAYDLTQSAQPFRETYEIYGLLSSILNALALSLFGASLVTLGIFHSFLYASILCISFLIWSQLQDRYTAFSLLLIQVFLHPYIFYPWPNYPAYLFLLASILFLMRRSPSGFWLAGVCAAGAVMARFSVGPVIACAFSAYFLNELLQTRSTQPATFTLRISLQNLVRSALGFGIPILLFIGYLAGNQLFPDFLRSAVIVPRHFLDVWLGWSGLEHWSDLFWRLIGEMFGLPPHPYPFSILMVVINYSALFVIVRAVVFRWRKNIPQSSIQLMIAVIVLSSYSGSLHILEIFRVVVGGFIGVVLIPWLLAEYIRSQIIKRILFYSLVFVFLAALTPNLLLQAKPSTSMLWQTRFIGDILDHEKSSSVELIDGKSWPVEMITQVEHYSTVIEYYRRKCQIESLANLTHDLRLQYINPGMKKIQREPSRIPYHDSDTIFPDEKAQRDRLILAQKLLVIVPKTDGEDENLPSGYSPYQLNNFFTLLVPTSCLEQE